MVSKNENKNNTLLDTLIKYVLPLLNKNNIKNKKQSKLEELANTKGTRIKPLEFIFLEDLINSFLEDKDGIKTKNKTKTLELLEIQENDENKNNANNEMKYFVAFERKKEAKDDSRCAVDIKYEENEDEEKLDVKIHINQNPLDNYSINKGPINSNQKNKLSNKEYSITIKKEKENKTKDKYSISLIYENNYEEERLSISYKSAIGTYLNKRQQALHDFTDRVPGKHVNVFPESVMGSVLGFTYLGENFMALRADLTGSLKKMVDIHESIHTPDEYETRILTDWIMSRQKVKYIK